MEVEPRSDLSENYRAIDGIALGSAPGVRDANGNMQYSEPELAVRSDVRSVLEMGDDKFRMWYDERKEAITRQLADYELFASIPNLGYGRESQKLTFGT